jgi:4-amino-4-deoxy-L-arabinose transferase-like glycosyltransferase
VRTPPAHASAASTFLLGGWQPWAALLLLAAMFAQLLGAATQLSATIDEGFHITSGYEYLRTGHMRLFDEHVPVAKALFAWPLSFVPDLTPPEEAPGWAEGNLIRAAQETVLAYQPIDRVIVSPRVAVALLTVLLGITVYRWSATLFGRTAGVFALALFAFDPNILAHGSLATTDMGAVAFIFWAVWAFSRYLYNPNARRWWATALLLGLALGAKLTALLLLPVLAVLALVDAWVKADRDRLQALLRRALSYCCIVAVAALVVWAAYAFEVRALPNVANGTIALPAASHIERWLRLQDNLNYGRESFLLGQNGMHGWWQYFPVAFALKTPIPTLLLCALTLGALAFGRRQRPTDELALWLFPLLYAIASLASTLNIGYRHLLPLLPFLFVSAGRLNDVRLRAVPSVRPERSEISGQQLVTIRRTLLVILVLWLCVGTLLIRPHYLAFFNAVAGGADEGYKFLADSNTDWGQTLKALAVYQRNNRLGPVRLSQFTFLDPTVYGVAYEPIAPMRDAAPVLPRRLNPAPGLYAISATTLDGVPLPLPSMYDWFRHREPLAKIGHAMFLFDVTAEDGSTNWVAQCTVPVTALPPEAVAEGFGADDLRQVYFDCERSWIFPGGGASPGWYSRATPGIDGLRWPTNDERLEWWPDWTRQLLSSALLLSYVQPTPGELPPFAIWEWKGISIAPPATISEGDVAFNGPLVFLGYEKPQAAQPGTGLDVLTYWRVVEQPTRPLSLMLHLVSENGVPIGVGDGLGVPIDKWQSGDIIVQRHELTVPEETPPGDYWFQAGVYWLDTLERWTVAEESKDSLLLGPVKIGR